MTTEKTPCKWLLFDLDGTLTDPFEGIANCFLYALSKMGCPLPEKASLAPVIGPPLSYSFQTFFGLSEEDSQKAIVYYRERFSGVGLFENRPYDGVKEMLSALEASGFSLAVATSKPTVFARRILEKFDLAAHFSLILGSELDGSRVEKGDVIADALSLLSAKAEDCLMVGDRKFDVLGAKENGIPCVGVLFGYGSEEELSLAGARALVNTPQQLKDYLLAHYCPAD